MKDEGYIRSRAGSRNPFRVPEGYFEGFASQMMDKLPDCEPRVIPMGRSRLRVLRPLLYAAACVCVAVFCLTAYLMEGQPSAAGSDADVAVASQYQNISLSTYEDDIMDCAMMDNADIYAYLSSEH